ncbi:MAG: hypothetical protein CSYNP_03270 [Syntrophus sp. SKADARSKE-3]|nr:hypothetical protein [Syntrophus sp. SKADARSKE-3]
MIYKTTFRRIVIFLALCLMILLTTSCALLVMGAMTRPEKLAGTQKDGNFRGSECQNVLVISLMENTSQRVAVENVFADRLTQPGLIPIAGSLKLPTLSLLKDRAFLEKLMQEEHIDHVITVEVKDVAENDLKKWPGTWLATPLPKGDLADVTLSHGTTKNVHFEIGLWALNSMKREWTGTTRPLDRSDILRDVPAAADSTAYTLKKDKILRL